MEWPEFGQARFGRNLPQQRCHRLGEGGRYSSALVQQPMRTAGVIWSGPVTTRPVTTRLVITGPVTALIVMGDHIMIVRVVVAMVVRVVELGADGMFQFVQVTQRTQDWLDDHAKHQEHQQSGAQKLTVATEGEHAPW